MPLAAAKNGTLQQRNQTQKEGREAVMFGGRGLGEGACLAFGWFIAYVCLLDKIPNTHPIWDVHCSIHSLRCCVYSYCTVCVDLLTLEWQALHYYNNKISNSLSSKWPSAAQSGAQRSRLGGKKGRVMVSSKMCRHPTHGKPKRTKTGLSAFLLLVKARMES